MAASPSRRTRTAKVTNERISSESSRNSYWPNVRALCAACVACATLLLGEGAVQHMQPAFILCWCTPSSPQNMTPKPCDARVTIMWVTSSRRTSWSSQGRVDRPRVELIVQIEFGREEQVGEQACAECWAEPVLVDSLPKTGEAMPLCTAL